jgi:hypothetical protein
VSKAQSLPVITSVGNFIKFYVPQSVVDTLDQSGQLSNPQGAATKPADPGTTVTEGQSKGLDNLIEGTTTNGKVDQPAFGQDGTKTP